MRSEVCSPPNFITSISEEVNAEIDSIDDMRFHDYNRFISYGGGFKLFAAHLQRKRKMSEDHDFEEEKYSEDYEREEDYIDDRQLKRIERLRRKTRARINGYIKDFGKQSLEELTRDEGEELKTALELKEERLREERVMRVGGYIIEPIENGFYEVRKSFGPVYTVHPQRGLCDCPDKELRMNCGHIELLIEHIPELKEEFDFRKKVRADISALAQVLDWTVDETRKKVKEIKGGQVKKAQVDKIVPLTKWIEMLCEMLDPGLYDWKEVSRDPASYVLAGLYTLTDKTAKMIEFLESMQ